MNRTIKIQATGFLALSAVASWAQAPRSTVLPPPEEPFKGVIGRTYKESVMDKMRVIKAPEGAPNVLIVLIDDAGFGQASTFGGQIPTPTLERLAQSGLRYTRYHTTALSSPTRAAILTGRNHHSAATGTITEFADSFPGYTGSIPRSTALIAEILRQNGYSTAAFGKWHNTADWEQTAAGPFDRWPTSLGFDHWYGFQGGQANQWNTPLYNGTTPVDMRIPPGKQGHYTLNDALADNCINWLHQQKSVTPDRPFFIYFAPGATHAPHHVPKEWMDKFKGQFDQGWDKYREETYQRQLKLGVIPPDAKLTPRPKEIPAYDSLTPDQRKGAARLMEAFAGFTAQTDYEVGRIVDAIAAMGQLDNTLIFYEVGDNGASAEGGLFGAFEEFSVGAGLEAYKLDNEYLLTHLDEVGGPKADNHIPVGWAWAMNTPFQWTKQIASHFGGTRNPLVIYWPKRIRDKGGIRTQFHHAIDITPTILQAAGIPEPTMVNGVAQKPIEGVSMTYSFDDPKTTSPRKVQYFEMLGNRALYDNGWLAACRHGRLPWMTHGTTVSFEDDKWELYNIDEDFSEAVDLAAKNPQQLRNLQDEFWAEAAKYNVLPLDDRFADRFDPSLRPSLTEGRTNFTYFSGASRIPESSAPNIKNRSYTITAYVDIPNAGAEGVLVAEGGPNMGYTLYIKDRKPTYQYTHGAYHWTITSLEKLPPGPAIIRFEFAYDGGGIGKGGTGRLYVNDKKAGEVRMEMTNPVRFSFDETFDTGRDTGLPVSGAYQSPFAFTGTLEKVVVDIAPARLASDDLRTIEEGRQRMTAASD